MLSRAFSLVVLATVFLAGCGGEDGADDKKNTSQVAAKVNGKEITVHQVNQALKGVRLPQGQMEKVSQQDIANKVLDNLISQEVILQEAEKMKLDRDPVVLSAIEAAKQKVLVDAYMARVLSKDASVEESKVRAYFDENDKLFSNRKVFTYTQVLIATPPEKQEELVEKVKELNDLEAFLNYLKENKQEYKIAYETKGSEKLSKPLLQPMYAIKPGDIGYLKLTDGLLVIKLNSVVDQPVAYEQAKPVIERFLFTQDRKETSAELVKNLREKAEVEYFGDFSKVEQQEVKAVTSDAVK